MLDFLFYIFIYPIQLVLEIIFSVLYTSIFKGNIGIALCGLSFAVSLLCLPMYTKAEHIQKLERSIQKKLSQKINTIKKHFSGDEQYFLLSAYYKENNYHPVYALRSSLSLLIQIPFFIAAYTFLSHLDLLTEKSLLFLNDLSAPDGLIKFRSLSINALPFAMTFINLFAGIVYSKDLLIKEKIQLYLTPVIFLILLYNSPSALVLYWTLNNIFSLIKILLFKVKNPKLIIYIGSCLCTALFTVYVLFIRYNDPARAFRNKIIAVVIFLAFLILPVLYNFIVKYIKKFGSLFTGSSYSARIFIISIICIWVLTGFFVPANIISSDPVIFSSVQNINNPLSLLRHTAVQGAGLLILWPLLLFSMFTKKIKLILSIFTSSLAVFFFANYFAFRADYGIISETLRFNLISGQYLAKGILFQVINIFCFFLIAISLYFLYRSKKNNYVYTFLIILSLGTFVYSILKVSEIIRVTDSLKEIKTAIVNDSPYNNDTYTDGYIKVSKNGKNVYIIMLDGAISSYFSIFLNERPEIKDCFSGFIYYPNTASLYRRTMFGAPPIFGGYEYTSYNLEGRRKNITIKEKQKEAVTLLPLLFLKEGFSSYVSDIPDNGFFDNSPDEHFAEFGIETINLEGKFINKYRNEILDGKHFVSNAKIDELLKRNMLMLSLVKTIPYFLRDFLYINGKYWSTKDYNIDSAIGNTTVGSYTALHYFPEITQTVEDKNIFHIITSNITHDHVYLQFPDYTLQAEITEYGNNFFNGNDSFKSFHVNAAAFLLLSKWFNHLRNENVWDNTRIIIVSDHGDSGLDNPNFSSFQNNYVLSLNSLLLVKDFNQNEPMLINNDFMTSADVPLLALNGINSNPVNPFTENILISEKSDGIFIYTQGYTNSKWYQGTSFLNDNSAFFHVKDNIFEKDNWTELKYKDFKNKL